MSRANLVTYLPSFWLCLGGVGVLAYCWWRHEAPAHAARNVLTLSGLASLASGILLLVAFQGNTNIQGVVVLPQLDGVIDAASVTALLAIAAGYVIMLRLSRGFLDDERCASTWAIVALIAGVGGACCLQDSVAMLVPALSALGMLLLLTHVGRKELESNMLVAKDRAFHLVVALSLFALGASILAYAHATTAVFALFSPSSLSPVLVGIADVAMLAGASWFLQILPLGRGVGEIADDPAAPEAPFVSAVAAAVGICLLTHLVAGQDSGAGALGSMLAMAAGTIAVVVGAIGLWKSTGLSDSLNMISVIFRGMMCGAVGALWNPKAGPSELLPMLAVLLIVIPVSRLVLLKIAHSTSSTAISDLEGLHHQDRRSGVFAVFALAALWGFPPLPGFLVFVIAGAAAVGTGAPWFLAVLTLGWIGIGLGVARIGAAVLRQGDFPKGRIEWPFLHQILLWGAILLATAVSVFLALWLPAAGGLVTYLP